MQNNIQFTFLSNDEMLHLNGGNDGGPPKDSSFFENVSYYTRVVAICIYQFAKSSAEYQASLPPSLKK